MELLAQLLAADGEQPHVLFLRLADGTRHCVLLLPADGPHAALAAALCRGAPRTVRVRERPFLALSLQPGAGPGALAGSLYDAARETWAGAFVLVPWRAPAPARAALALDGAVYQRGGGAETGVSLDCAGDQDEDREPLSPAADGRFTSPRGASATYTLEVCEGGTNGLALCAADPIAAGTTGIVVEVGSPRALRVQVTDRDGRPLAGRAVWLEDPENREWLLAGAMAEDDGSPQARSDAAGVAQLRARADRSYAVGAGGGAYLPGVADVRPGGTTNVVIALERGCTLAGRVLRGGQPVAGATVIASTLPAQAETNQLSMGDSVSREAETDADGRFMLEGLPAGATHLLVATGMEHDVTSVLAVQTVTAVRQVEPQALTVSLAAPGTLRIKSPAAWKQRTVALFVREAFSGLVVAQAESRNGFFADIPLCPARYEVIALPQGPRGGVTVGGCAATVEIRSGATTDAVLKPGG